MGLNIQNPHATPLDPQSHIPDINQKTPSTSQTSLGNVRVITSQPGDTSSKIQLVAKETLEKGSESPKSTSVKSATTLEGESAVKGTSLAEKSTSTATPSGLDPLSSSPLNSLTKEYSSSLQSVNAPSGTKTDSSDRDLVHKEIDTAKKLIDGHPKLNGDKEKFLTKLDKAEAALIEVLNHHELLDGVKAALNTLKDAFQSKETAPNDLDDLFSAIQVVKESPYSEKKLFFNFFSSIYHSENLSLNDKQLGLKLLAQLSCKYHAAVNSTSLTEIYGARHLTPILQRFYQLQQPSLGKLQGFISLLKNLQQPSASEPFHMSLFSFQNTFYLAVAKELGIANQLATPVEVMRRLTKKGQAEPTVNLFTSLADMMRKENVTLNLLSTILKPPQVPYTLKIDQQELQVEARRKTEGIKITSGKTTSKLDNQDSESFLNRTAKFQQAMNKLSNQDTIIENQRGVLSVINKQLKTETVAGHKENVSLLTQLKNDYEKSLQHNLTEKTHLQNLVEQTKTSLLSLLPKK